MGRHPFDLLMELDTAYIRLDCAALHLARDEYPALDLRGYLRRLDQWADDVAALRPGTAATLRYAAMREVLIDGLGFAGNDEDYYDADNSFLNRVIDRRIGIPISLSVLWIEIGRRLKWPVGGVALPGHFLVRFDDPERFVLADPFHHGRTLSLDDCREIVKHTCGKDVKLDRRVFEPVDVRAVLARMLHNLRVVYLAVSDLPRLAKTLRHLIAVQPENAKHLQELADVRFRMGDLRGAYSLLSAYLQREPDAADSALVRQNLRRLHAAMRAMN
jgi:regulator of sirC expression with transglutaminase-like and TPR domain